MNERLAGLDNVAPIEPLDYSYSTQLLDISTLMLTDSGGIQEEPPALGKPVLIKGETTGRPDGFEAGTAKLVGTDADRIVAATGHRLNDSTERWLARPIAWGDGKATQRVVELLAQTA